MGKAAKWLRSLFTGKNDKDKCMETRSGPILMNHPPQERKRWSFRWSMTTDRKSVHVCRRLDSDMCQKRKAVVAADAVVIQLTERAIEAVEEVAAIKIQSIFRSYLATKALRALKGFVKLQALIRGHLVRNQPTVTLRSMQAMVTAQARARIQRLLMLEEAQLMPHHKQHLHKRSPYEMDDNVKIVEMDLGEIKESSESRNNNHSYVQAERRDHRLATYSGSTTPYRRGRNQEVSPARSSYIERSPRAYSGQSSINDLTNYHLFPNYMAKTESLRAKARSHSAPKQWTDSCERQPSKRRPSVDGRSVSKGYRQPWPDKLDGSSVSPQESECGSTSTKCCRSLIAYEACRELSFDKNSTHNAIFMECHNAYWDTDRNLHQESK